MEFEKRIRLILIYLKIIEEKYPNAASYGTQISTIKLLFSRINREYVSNADIKYLFDQEYIQPWYMKPGLKFIYIANANYFVKVTGKGIDYLKTTQEALPQSIQVIQGQIANVGHFGNVYAITNIAGAFKQVYIQIEQETKGNLREKEELTQYVKDLEKAISENNFPKIKEVFDQLRDQPRPILPLLQAIIVESVKKWLLGM